jgi:hypothetical protein
MIPIIDFCWQEFNPVEVDDVEVRHLYNLSKQHGPDLFVLHDRVHRMSALVIPDLVTETVERLDLLNLRGETSAAAIGLLDLLRRDQITVNFEQPASLVVIAAAWQQAGTVIAVDNSARPRGLFIPSTVAERLPQASLIQEQSPQLRESVGQLTRIGNLAGAIVAIESKFDSFHSEHLNRHAANPYICDGPLPHKTFSPPPCREHSGAIVTMRNVASS